MAEQLYAAIRRGKAKPGMAAEFAAGALPMVQKDGRLQRLLFDRRRRRHFTNKAVAESSSKP
jgi:hypothetical protein